MLNYVNSPDIINFFDSAIFIDFVNLSDLMIPFNFTDLSDVMRCSHSIRGFYLIKAFDHIRVFNKLRKLIRYLNWKNKSGKLK
jgi:hypothetical protein